MFRLIKVWETMINHLLIESRNYPVLVVRYEDLKSNTLQEIMQMLEFLGYEYTPDELKERLNQKFTTFYRNRTSTFEHYTAAQKQYINSIITKVHSRLQLLSQTPLPLKTYIKI